MLELCLQSCYRYCSVIECGVSSDAYQIIIIQSASNSNGLYGFHADPSFSLSSGAWPVLIDNFVEFARPIVTAKRSLT